MAAIRWTHLPVAGGIYDQHPKFISDMTIILEEKSAHEAREADKREKQLGKKNQASKGRRRK